MKLADGIRRHGFRKWYERQLLQSHAHLVLTFMCMIGIFSAIEAFNAGAMADRAFDLLTIVLCGAVGVWALRRYIFFLNHAEAAANQADCPACQSYGRFTLEAEDAREGRLQVCCRKCSQRWTILD